MLDVAQTARTRRLRRDLSRGLSRDLVRRLACVWVLSLSLWVSFSAGAAAAICPTFSAGLPTGIVSESGIAEASGLVASRQNTGVLWVHNDSGNSTTLYALSSTGATLASYAPSGGVTNQDWEDLAIGPGPVPGSDSLYVGDIGDNDAIRSSILIYRFEEPSVTGPGSFPLAGGVAIELTYPDGPHDAETLLSDPISGDLFIVTKNLVDGLSGFYRAPFPHAAGAPIELELAASYTFPGNVLQFATTGGDISASGDEILIRAYLRAYLWPRSPGSSLAEALAQPPCLLTLEVEPQGEAIGFAADAGGYFSLSEGASQPLYFYGREPGVPSLSDFGLLALVLGLVATGFFVVRGMGNKGN